MKLVLPPTARVKGVVRLAENPGPSVLIPVMLRLAVPELLSVTLFVLLCPTVMLPKLRLVGFAVSMPATPVPVRPIVSGWVLAELDTETLPFAPPLAVGLNCTLKLVLAPAANVTGKLIPLTE